MSAHLIVVSLFWFSTATLVGVYLLYPLAVRLAVGQPDVSVRRAPAVRKISIIITAYNEEKGIAAKLDNILASNFPIDLAQIIVVSDASSDATDEIVRAYGRADVCLLRIEGRQGKTACQNAAAALANGEILIFTDATTHLHANALRNLVAHFADGDVGCAAGRLVYRSRLQNPTGNGSEAYWDYEIKLRLAESALGSLIGVSGCLYAIRRDAYRPIAPQLISDFVVSMKMREQSLRTVLAADALCFEETLQRSTHELSMRVRVALRSLHALISERKFLNPFRFGFFSIQLWFHKLLRYASPFFWLVAFATNAVLAAQGGIYMGLLAGQIALLGMGALGFALQSRRSHLGVLGKPYYFLLTNVASLIAALRYLRGERIVIWKPMR